MHPTSQPGREVGRTQFACRQRFHTQTRIVRQVWNPLVAIAITTNEIKFRIRTALAVRVVTLQLSTPHDTPSPWVYDCSR